VTTQTLRRSWSQAHRLGQTAQDTARGVVNPNHAVVAFRVAGALDLDALDDAWRQLQRRHPVLGSAWDLSGSDWHVGAAAPAGLCQVPSCGTPEQDLDALRTACCAPFDLAAGPVGRLVAIAGPEATQVALVVEHLVSDAWSLNPLTRGLGSLYARARGAPSPEPPVAQTSFADVVRRQNAFISSADGQQALTRQVRRMASVGVIPAMPIQGHRRPDVVHLERRASLVRHVGPDIHQRLRALGRPYRLTALNVMNAALHHALHSRSVSGTGSVATTLSTANRWSPRLHDVVGWLASKVGVVTEPGDHPATAEYLTHFRSRLLDALDGSAVPWAALIQATAPHQLGHHTTIPYVTFNGRPAAMRQGQVAPDLPGLHVTPLPLSVGWHDASIATFWNERDDGVTVHLDVKLDHYDEASVAALWDDVAQRLRTWAGEA